MLVSPPLGCCVLCVLCVLCVWFFAALVQRPDVVGMDVVGLKSEGHSRRAALLSMTRNLVESARQLQVQRTESDSTPGTALALSPTSPPTSPGGPGLPAGPQAAPGGAVSRPVSGTSLALSPATAAPGGAGALEVGERLAARYAALELLCETETVFLNRLSLLVKHYIAPLEEIAGGASLSQRKMTARVGR